MKSIYIQAKSKIKKLTSETSKKIFGSFIKTKSGKNNFSEKEIDEKTVLFQGDIDLLGNSKVFFDYLYKMRKYKFIWLLQDKNVKHNLPKDVEVIFISDKNFLQKAHSAKFIIISSVCLFHKTDKQIGMVLWHGMGFKTMGYTEENPPQYYKEFEKYYFFVTSDFFKVIFAARFRPNFNNIYITGQPRNDLILSKTKNKNDLSKLLNLKLSGYKKIIVFTPTFKGRRKWDGKKEIDVEMKNIFYLQDYQEEELIRYLEDNKILLIVKPHWADEYEYMQMPRHSKNIIHIYDSDLIKSNSQFYEYFHQFDAMITDYSSIYIDYLMLNRPIIFIQSTIKKYFSTRGCIFRDNMSYFMPGNKVFNHSDLMKSLRKALVENETDTKREEMIPIFHKYIDSSSNKRIYEIMTSLQI